MLGRLKIGSLQDMVAGTHIKDITMAIKIICQEGKVDTAAMETNIHMMAIIEGKVEKVQEAQTCLFQVKSLMRLYRSTKLQFLT